MNDPVLLVTVLKVALLLIIGGAAVIILREIVLMASGREIPPARQAPAKDT